MKKEIVSQYKASLKMLGDTIVKCPDSLWENNEFGDAFWRIVYHTLFYTSLYLSNSNSDFIPWVNHKINYNNLGKTTRDNTPIIIDNSYSKDELMKYFESIFNNCEKFVYDTDLNDKSGVEWLPMNKIELHLYNIRHIQHHVGQLVERLHQSGIKGINWERMG